jgi:hypothetical protein
METSIWLYWDDLYHSISREEREVAKKYLNPNQRLVLDYIPTLETVQIKP